MTSLVDFIRFCKSLKAKKGPEFDKLRAVCSDVAYHITSNHSKAKPFTPSAEFTSALSAMSLANDDVSINLSSDVFCRAAGAAKGAKTVNDFDSSVETFVEWYRAEAAEGGLEPTTAKFWRVHFGNAPGAIFDNCVKKSVQQANLEGAETTKALEVLRFQSLSKLIREEVVGNSTRVNASQLQDLVDRSPSYKYPFALIQLIESYWSKIPKEDTAMNDLLDTLDIPKDVATHVSICTRDAGVTLKELWKLNPVRATDRLRLCGVPQATADVVSFEIHKRKQRALIDNVTSKAAPVDCIERALIQIRRGDEEILLRSSGVEADTVAKLVDGIIALRGDISMSTLDLSGNNLRPEGAYNMVKLLSNAPPLRNLVLAGNALNEDGMETICAEIPKSNVSVLNLSVNHGLRRGAEAVGKLLLTYPTLHTLIYNSNSLSNSVSVFSDILANPACRLRKLCLANNHFFTEGAIQLFQSLRDNITLTELDVSGNGIGDDAFLALAKTLTQNTALTSIDLSRNSSVGVKGVAGVSNAVLKNTTLLHLGLDGVGGKDMDEHIQDINGKIHNNQHAAKLKLQDLAARPMESWSVDDSVQFGLLSLRRVHVAKVFASKKIDGMTLMSYTRIHMAKDGITSVHDQDEVLARVGLVVARLNFDPEM